MSPRSSFPRAFPQPALLLLALGAAALASCAPRVIAPASLDPVARRTRFERALEMRARRSNAVEADVSLWARWRGAEDLPGVQARLLLAGPDAFRLRVESLVGTALDLAARGDSVVAYVPARRAGIELDAERDSLGLRAPGRIVVRSGAADWRPPEGAWHEASWEESLLVVRWIEEGDSVRLAVGSSGLPARITVERPGRGSISARYESWAYTDGVAWPALVELTEPSRDVEVRWKWSRVRFPDRLDPARISLRLPAGAQHLTREDLRRVLERIAAF